MRGQRRAGALPRERGRAGGGGGEATSGPHLPSGGLPALTVRLSAAIPAVTAGAAPEPKERVGLGARRRQLGKGRPAGQAPPPAPPAATGRGRASSLPAGEAIKAVREATGG